MRTDEITIKKIKKTERILNKHFKNTFQLGDVEEFVGFKDRVPQYKTVNKLCYVGFKSLDKVDTRLSVKSYSKHKYTTNIYKSITPRYIQEKIMKEKVTLRLVNYVLINMVKQAKCKIMFCGNIKKIVYHHHPNWGGAYGREVLDCNTYMKSRMKKEISDYKFVKNYLVCNKLENSNS